MKRTPPRAELAAVSHKSDANNKASSETVESLTVTGELFVGGEPFEGASGPVSAYGGEKRQIDIETTAYGPGWTLGNLGGWSVQKSTYAAMKVATRGICQANNIVLNKLAVGDTAGHYVYVNSDGGVTAFSDEGVTGMNIEVAEPNGYFHGTVQSTTGIGDKAPVLTYTSGNRWTTDGAFLLNITQGTIAGSLNGPSTPLLGSAYLNSLPVTGITVSDSSGALPLTTAWGTCAAIANPGTTADINTLITVDVTLGLINGVAQPFVVGGVVVIAGPVYPEQCPITEVGDVLEGVQAITIGIRNPHTATVTIFQGGIAGQYISFDENLALSGMRSSYYAYGSLTGVDLIYGFSFGGAIGMALPRTGDEAATITGGFHLYPGAEIVSNASTGYTPILEPNGIAWAVGDIVENPHYPAQGGHGLWITKSQTTPSNGSFGNYGIAMHQSGAGITGSYTGFRLRNESLFSQYSSYTPPGPLNGPRAVSIEGQWDSPFTLEYGPGAGKSLITVLNWAGKSAPSPSIGIIALPSAAGNFAFSTTSNCFTMPALQLGSLTFGANTSISNGGITTTGSGVSSFDRINCNHINSASNSSFQNIAVMYDITSVRGIASNGIVKTTYQLVTTGTFIAGSTGQLTISPSGDLATSGNLEVAGLAQSIVTKSTTYTATVSDYTILANAAAEAFTVTLPGSPAVGMILVVKKIDSSPNTITVYGNGHLIDGASTLSILTQYASYKLQYDGAAWWVL